MALSAPRVTYIGGPTALIEFGGLRLLTDPTLDPAGTDYPTAVYTLHKTSGPALSADDIGRLDGILLSHDHHFDNLDHAGRALLGGPVPCFTTAAGAERLGAGARGLSAGDRILLPTPDGGEVELTATPARHGPANGDRGPVIGFLLRQAGTGPALYLSGDTVWYDAVARLGQSFEIPVALLNLGAAKVAVAGPEPLTFTALEAVELARAWPDTLILPLHFEGWGHFTEGPAAVRQAFAAANLSHRLLWPGPGVPIELPWPRGV